METGPTPELGETVSGRLVLLTWSASLDKPLPILLPG